MIKTIHDSLLLISESLNNGNRHLKMLTFWPDVLCSFVNNYIRYLKVPGSTVKVIAKPFQMLCLTSCNNFPLFLQLPYVVPDVIAPAIASCCTAVIAV